MADADRDEAALAEAVEALRALGDVVKEEDVAAERIVRALNEAPDA